MTPGRTVTGGDRRRSTVTRSGRWALLVVAVVGAMLLTACGNPWVSPAGAAPGPAPAPGVPGPYAVGRTTFEIVDASRDGRKLTVDAWYPADPAATAGRARSYYDLLLAKVQSPLAFDAPPVSKRGLFPLVAFSHGSGGIRFQSWFLTENLASHGFVVVAPDHAGNTSYDLLFGTSKPFDVVAHDRPLDISSVITRMLERDATPGDAFDGRIDPHRVAVAGHSFGGFTALAMAAGYGTDRPDPRVRAIVPISPASQPFTDAELESIQVPVMLVGGTSDVTTPIATQTVRPWELIPARPSYRVDVRKAGHGSFTDICTIRDAIASAGLPPDLLGFLIAQAEEGCAPDLIPIAEAHRLTNLYVTSFLERVLNHEVGYERYLTKGHAVSRHLAVDLYRHP